MKLAEYTLRFELACDQDDDAVLEKLVDDLPDPEQLAELIAQVIPEGCAHACVRLEILDGAGVNVLSGA